MKVILAVLVALGCVVGAIAGSYALTLYLVAQNNQRFCVYLENVTPRTPKPSNPAKNPSREANYQFTVKTKSFERSIGCKA